MGFIQTDYEIMSSRHEVEWFRFTFSPACVLRLFLRLRNKDLAFCWFGNVWSALAVLFGKEVESVLSRQRSSVRTSGDVRSSRQCEGPGAPGAAPDKE
jgi:hypothetical protein